MSQTCAILGCGWMGLPLARHLLDKEYAVRGSTTRQEKLPILQSAGIQPFHLTITPDGIEGEWQPFLETDYLVVNIPPGRKDPARAELYPQLIGQLVRRLEGAPVQGAVFVSSTAVYGGRPGKVDVEDLPTPDTASGEALVAAEKVFSAWNPEKVSIVRMGGLVGEDRHPVVHLAGKQGLEAGMRPVNLIHQVDAVGIIASIVKKNIWGETFNGVCEEHPARSTYYTWAALKAGLALPDFKQGDLSEGKSVSNEHLKKILKYKFRYPSPYDMLPG